MPLYQLAGLPKDKSQNIYDFLSFYAKCVWGGGHDLSYLYHI